MTQQRNYVELEATGVQFFSPCDESAFFEWLKKIHCVSQIRGRGLTLYISVDSSIVDECGLREILAVFFRYKVDMSQLIIFDREEFSDWFRSDQAYWHKNIF